MRSRFAAPWDAKLKAITAFALLVLGLAAWATVTGLGEASAMESLLGLTVVVGVVVLAAAMSVTGYSLQGSRLRIHRLGWTKTLDLSRLVDVEARPFATAGSFRTFGIGGLFGYIGRFRNPELGSYRAYATQSANTVILDFGDDKVVLTPDSPVEFAEAVRAHVPGRR